MHSGGMVVHSDSSHVLVARKIENQDVVTGSRAINTIYQNTTGKPMFVVASFSYISGTSLVNFKTDVNATPTTIVAFQASPHDIILSGFVLPGHYYGMLDVTGETLNVWTEWY